MADIVSGLFGLSSDQIRAQQRDQDMQMGLMLSRGTSRRRAPAYATGYNIGSSLARGLLSSQDPELQRAVGLEQTMQEVQQELGQEGISNPTLLYPTLAKKLSDKGFAQEAMRVQAQGQNEIESWNLRQAQTAKAQEEANLKANELKQTQQAQTAMTELFAKSAELGVAPTSDDIIQTISPYVSPDKLATLVQQSEDKKQYREFAMQQQSIANQNRLEAAIQRQADRKEIEQIRAENAKALKLISGGKDSGGKTGVYERIYGNQMVNSASELEVATTNLDALTNGGANTKTAGTFVNLDNRGVLNASAKTLTNILTPQESLQYESIMMPVLTNIGTLQNGGRRPTVNQTDILAKAIIAKAGEPYVAQIQKMGEIRQMADAAFRSAMTNQALTDEQKALMTDIQGQIKRAIPFTGEDVIKYAEVAKKNPNITLKQYLDNTKREGATAVISVKNGSKLTIDKEAKVVQAIKAVEEGRWTKAGAVSQLQKMGIEAY